MNSFFIDYTYILFYLIIQVKAMNDLQKKRHTFAHLLAAAVLKLYPDARPTIGPPTDNGFYYDFAFSTPITDADLKKIEKQMKKTINTWETMEVRVVSEEEARAQFKDNKYKTELIDGIVAADQEITFYTAGDFTDLCEGGHAAEPKKELDMKAFTLASLAGAYWRGDENNDQLTRIYGYAFNTKEELDAFMVMREEAKKRDHRKLGKELDLFTTSDVVGSGLPLLTEKGAVLRRVLERFIVDEEIKRGYKHVYTQDMAKVELYEKSGHYPYYKDSMYAPIDVDGERFMLRPMTCPHHFELFSSKPHSYRDLPLRYAEIAKLYRYEQSGELSGLMRVRSFNLADAHIFCADPEQAGSEISSALDLIDFVAEKFGLTMGEDYWYSLSLGDRTDDKKYFKDEAAWDTAEDILRNVLEKRDCHYVENEGEAAFYGPKIDIQMKNVLGKEDTAFTVQYDFVMPKRFDLKYKNASGEDQECVVVHRSSIGALERIIAFLIERYAGAFPFWLSPVQVKILPITSEIDDYAFEVKKELEKVGVRVDVDNDSETLGKRIRSAQKEKVPYMLVVGKEEVENKTVTVRARDNQEQIKLTIDEFISNYCTNLI